MLTCVLGEASCERSLAFVFLSKNKSVIPGEVSLPMWLLLCGLPGQTGLLCQKGVFCPTCPSPAGGSLTHSQALALSKRARDVTALQCCFFDPPRPSLAKEGSTFSPSPSSSGSGDVTALRCSEPLRSKVGGASKPSPCFAGWDRLGTACFWLHCAWGQLASNLCESVKSVGLKESAGHQRPRHVLRDGTAWGNF